MLRYLVSALAFLSTAAFAAGAPADAPAPPPPPMPKEAPAPAQPPQDSNAIVRPEVKIIQQGGATVEEYRLNGKLYKVKIIPKVGPPYYLLYPEGPAGPTVRQDIQGANVQTPFWVIFSW